MGFITPSLPRNFLISDEPTAVNQIDVLAEKLVHARLNLARAQDAVATVEDEILLFCGASNQPSNFDGDDYRITTERRSNSQARVSVTAIDKPTLQD